MGKTVFILTIISFLSKILGYLRDVILSNVYGASSVVDVYITTLSIPDMILEVFANTAVVAFVPVAVKKLSEGKNEINSFTSSYFKVIMMAIMFFFILMQTFPSFVIKTLAPGFLGDILDLAIKFLRIISFTALFRGISSILNAYLSVKKTFWPGAFLGIILDIFIILAIITSKRFDLVCLLPLGAVLGTVCQAVFLLAVAINKGIKINLGVSIITDDIKKVIFSILPAMMSVGVLQISTMFNRALASSIMEGGITMLNNASKISFIFENILVSSIITVLYPSLSEFYINKEYDKFDRTIENAINKIFVFLIPITGGLATLSNEIIQLMFGHGQYTQQNVQITSILMILNAIGIVGIAIQSFLTRAIFALNKGRLSMAISTSLICLFLVSSFSLKTIYGLYGIALATGISYTLGGLIYYIIVCKIRCGIKIKSNLIVFIKAFLSTIVMVSTILIIKKLAFSPIITILCSGIIGAVVYFCIAAFIGLKEADLMDFMLAKKIRRTNG